MYVRFFFFVSLQIRNFPSEDLKLKMVQIITIIFLNRIAKVTKAL